MIERTPFFYGWIVLAAGTFGMIMTTPGQTLGVSVFLDKIIADLGVSRSFVSLLYTVGTVTGSFALPFVGRFIDRRGPRTAVVFIAALFALACGYMGLVHSIAMLLLGFVLVRGLGQGSLSLLSQHVVNLWFVRRRGLAVGLTGLGMAAATAFFPMVIESLIASYGWREAYALLGLLVAVTILPTGALLFRSRPESFGPVPDGGRAYAAREVDYTLAEARRTRTFWLFVGSNTLVAALALAAIVPPGLVFVYGALLGATMGIRGGVQGAVFTHYFGRANLGAVMGTASTIGVLGTAVGPLLFALTEAASGSYAPVLLVSAAVSLVLAGVSAALRPFRADGSVA